MAKIQRYVSKELAHFLGRSLKEEKQYDLLIEILRSGWLTYPPHNPNISGNLSINSSANLQEMYSPEVVCFCDIPIDDMEIHMSKGSRFGISFLKKFLVEKGANRQVGLIVNLLLEYWLRGYYEPPHRTGHEVFPHPALQEYILYFCLDRA